MLFGHNLEVTRRGVWSGLSAQMVANRKFAAVSDGSPKQWQMIGDGSVATIDTTDHYAGRHSLSIRIATQGERVGVRQRQRILAVKKGEAYVLTVWVKTDERRLVSARIVDPSGSTQMQKGFIAVSGDWQALICNFSARTTAEDCTLEIFSRDKGVYRIGAVSLLPRHNFHGMRPDVVALLKRLRPGCLRFPGGCYAEFYTWKDGLLPVDQRPPIYHTGLDFLLRDTDDTDCHEIGIDEFMALCREVGAEPLLTARVSENRAQDAADWVSYCNGDGRDPWGRKRIERGHRAPYRVRWWFVGNELYSFGRGMAKGAAGAAAQTREFCLAMRNADSSVILVPSTKFGSGRDAESWNRPMLQTTAPFTDAVTAHQYLLDNHPLKDSDDFAFLLDAPERITKPMLNTVRNYLDTYRHGLGRNTGVAFDEWNTRWGLSGSVPMGLYAARMLNMLCREGTRTGLSMACYFMPVNEGAISVGPLASKMEPAGHVFELFKVHQHNRLLILPAHPDVDLCASASPDGKTIHITAVNGIKGEQELEISLGINHTSNPVKELIRLMPRSLDIRETVFDTRFDAVLPDSTGRIRVSLKPGVVLRMTLQRVAGI